MSFLRPFRRLSLTLHAKDRNPKLYGQAGKVQIVLRDAGNHMSYSQSKLLKRRVIQGIIKGSIIGLLRVLLGVETLAHMGSFKIGVP